MADSVVGCLFGQFQNVTAIVFCICDSGRFRSDLSLEKEVEKEHYHSVCPFYDCGVFGGGVSVKKSVKGSFKIEATVIIPIALFVINVLLYIMFYYHDKNVLTSAAHDSASYGSYMEQADKGEVEAYFEERIKGKLLLFSDIKKEINIKENLVEISSSATKGMMSLKVQSAVSKTDPESYIRTIRKIKKIGEDISENIYKE